jgi:aminomethyltransferase
MTGMDRFRQTPLYARHIRLGARMAPFGGYIMPISYMGILAEHKAARESAALFDTCHMGEIGISGPDALAGLEFLLSPGLASLAVGRCRYGLMCNPNGGVIDDLVVYRTDQTEFMLVVNAGTREGDFEWIVSHVSGDVRVRDISDSTAKVDIQGPGAPRIVESLVDATIRTLPFYGFHPNAYRGKPVIVSRTGYTGETGFELYAEPDLIGHFWDDCLEKGAVAAGLGARDTLRLEMGMPLYGHELSPGRNAGDTGFERAISKTKDFIGAEPIRASSPGKERLVGITFEGRQAAREGNRIFSEDGVPRGLVTSGSFAPSLGHAVALGYVEAGFAEPGMPVTVEARRTLAGRIVELPFYRNGTARKPLSDFLD